MHRDFKSHTVVFKSEVEELQKTIYDLKKQVKDLQSKMSVQVPATLDLEDDKTAKARKK